MLSNCILRSLPTLKTLTLTRPFHTSNIYSAEQSPLFKLRQKTGLAYSLCREALNKHDNNVGEAEAWLKAQELAHGLQKATKVRSRSAREGLFGLAVQRSCKLVTLLELNCETDFVARNQIFRDFAIKLTEHVASMRDEFIVQSIPNQNFVEELLPNKEQIQIIDDHIVPLIAKLGENIKFQRALHFRVKDREDVQLFGQIHSQVGQKRTDDLDIMTGRFGAIVALKNEVHNEFKPKKNIGNRLCQHVIGYNPSYIELPDDIRRHLEKAEKEHLAKQTAKAEIVEKEGEEYSDAEEAVYNTKEDWPSIMDQPLILGDGETVRDFCRENEVSIVYFNRFECGES